MGSHALRSQKGGSWFLILFSFSFVFFFLFCGIKLKLNFIILTRYLLMLMTLYASTPFCLVLGLRRERILSGQLGKKLYKFSCFTQVKPSKPIYIFTQQKKHQRTITPNHIKIYLYVHTTKSTEELLLLIIR